MADFDPADFGAKPVSSAPAPIPASPAAFNPADFGAVPANAGPSLFDPAKFGASMTSADDIRQRTATDKTYWPSEDEWRTLYNADQNKSLGQKAMEFGKGLLEVPGQVLSATAGTVKELASGPSAAQLGSTAVEAAGQTGKGLAGLVYGPLKYLGYTLPLNLKDAVTGNDEDAFQRWKADQGIKLAESRSTIAQDFLKSAGVQNPAAPLPATSATGATIGQFLVPLGGELAAGKALRAGAEANALRDAMAAPVEAAEAAQAENAARAAQGVPSVAPVFPAAAEQPFGAKMAATAGKGVTAAGNVAETVGSAPEKFTQWLTQKVTGSPDLAEKARGIVNLGEVISVPLAFMGGEGLVKAIGAVKIMEKLGAVGQGLGDFMTRVAEADPTSPFGRFMALAADKSAPAWMRELSAAPPVQLAVKAGRMGVAGAKGFAKGAALGTGLGLLSGQNAEETGQTAGGFGFFGAAHNAFTANNRAVFQKNLGNVARFVTANLQDGVAPETLRTVPADVVLNGALAEQMLPGWRVRFGDVQTATGQRAAGYTDQASKTIWIDPTQRDARATFYHELGHTWTQAMLSQHPEVAQSIQDALAADGRTLGDFKADYAKALYHGDAKLAENFIAQQDAADPLWAEKEIVSEAAQHALYDKDLLSAASGKATQATATQIALQSVGGWLSQLGVDTQANAGREILPSFKNVFTSPELRKLTFKLLKQQRKYALGASVEGSEAGAPLTSQDLGSAKMPFYKTAEGQQINPYGQLVPDGKGGQKFVKWPASELRRRLTTEQKALDKYFTKKAPVTAVPEAVWNDPDITPWTKESLKQMSDAIKSGSQLEMWYHRLNKEHTATSDRSWRADVARNLGNVQVSLQSGFPLDIQRTKNGNLIAHWVSMEAARQKLEDWANRNGELSLKKWGGDRGKFWHDSEIYLRNHAEGRPGETGLDPERKNLLNAFWFGDNKEFQATNPLRADLRGRDRNGVFRSLRLDRAESVTPIEGTLPRPDWSKGKMNLSPVAEGRLSDEALHAVGKDAGFTFDGDFKLFADQPGLLQFTFRHLPKTDAAQGATFYAPENATADQIKALAQNKAAQFRGAVKAFSPAVLNRRSPYALPQVTKLFREFPEDMERHPEIILANDGDAYRALMQRFPELQRDSNWAGTVVQNLFNSSQPDVNKSGVDFVQKLDETPRYATPGADSITGTPSYFGDVADVSAAGTHLRTGAQRETALRLLSQFLPEDAGAPADTGAEAGASSHLKLKSSGSPELNQGTRTAVKLLTMSNADFARADLTPGQRAAAEAARRVLPVIKDDWYLNENLDELDGGSEATVYRHGNFVYKQFRIGEELNKPHVVGIMLNGIHSEDALNHSQLDLTFGNLFDFLNRAARGNQFEGVAPVEILGITKRGQPVVKQPYLPFEASSRDVQEWKSRYGLPLETELSMASRMRGFKDAVADEQPVIFDPWGNSYATADAREDNFRKDNRGNVFLVDGLIRPITPTDVEKNPGLAAFAPTNPDQIRYSPKAAKDAFDRAAKENRPKQVIDNRLPVVNKGGMRNTLPHAVGDTVIPVIHLSSAGDLKKVDPQFFGRGRANRNDTRGGNKAYFFVEGSKLSGDAGIFGQGGYQAYRGEIPGGKIYDLRLGKPDALGWGEQYTLNREKADYKVRDAGYDGIMVQTGDGRDVIMMFKPVKVKRLGFFKGTRAEIKPLSAQPKKAISPKNQRWYSPAVEERQGTKTPNEEVRRVAEGYTKLAGISESPHTGVQPVNENLARRIADFYQDAKHAPNDPAVRRSYHAFAHETIAQWHYITSHGVKMEPWTEPGQPYKNSAEMMEDVRQNKHLWFFPTDEGFGSNGTGPETHPLLAKSGIKVDGRDLPINDVFRAVHDYFGHAKEGYEFGPRGELNAYLSHVRMYSREARPAMSAETLGQNSWVNYGPHLRDASGSIPKKGERGFIPLAERPFAEQKATVLPHEFVNEATGRLFSPSAEEPKPSEKPFYSKLTQVVDQKFSGKQMPAAQLAAILRNPQNGVKADELKWSGLDDFLKSKGKVSREEVDQFLRDNSLQVKEVVKGNNVNDGAVAAWWNDEGGANESRPFADLNPDERYEAVKRYQNEVGDFEPTATKFENYQLPGGENYREILFQLPEPKVDVEAPPVPATDLPEGYEYIHDSTAKPEREWGIISDGQTHARPVTGIWWGSKEEALKDFLTHHNEALRIAHEEQTRQAKKGKTFINSHWNEPNVVAHTRVNDRVDADGKPGLFVEEIQSDWHQKGRKEGYSGQPQNGFQVFVKGHPAMAYATEAEARAHVNRALEYNAPSDVEIRPVTVENKGLNAVPDAPWKKDWQEMVFRRLVRQAAEEGKDWIGWTTGEQQAERYDLSKQVSSIAYNKGKGEHSDLYGIRVEGKNGETIYERSVSAKELPDLVGKEMAQKIVDGEGAKSEVELSNGDVVPMKKLTGLDLKVGGSGMKGFYDKILVDYANKFGKKFGAKVEDRKVPTDAPGLVRQDASSRRWFIDHNGVMDTDRTFATEAEAQSALDKGAAIHSLPITPEMKNSVLREGVALFSPKAENQERITAAVVKSPEGKIFKGRNHNEAIAEAVRSGSSILDAQNNFDSGFSTNLRPFVNRAEADDIARAAGQTQVTKKWTPGQQLMAEHLKPGSFSPKAEDLDPIKVKRYASRIVNLTKRNGGATFNIATGKTYTSGQDKLYIVAVYPQRTQNIAPADLTPEKVAAFIKANQDLLADKNNSVGTWLDKDAGTVALDITVTTPDKAFAIAQAKQANQKAIWDLKNGKEIYTGGTGAAPDNSKRDTDLTPTEK